jgi:hypothetical protein
VKRRAEGNYYNLFGDAKSKERQQNERTYNYNWPYDFFSLVELAKLEIDVEIK